MDNGFRPAPLPHVAMIHPVLWHGKLHVVCLKCRKKIIVTAEEPLKATATFLTSYISDHLKKANAPHNSDDIHKVMAATLKEVKKMMSGTEKLSLQTSLGGV